MNNFLITAMGRSGTRFLAELMNRSRKWTVLHEPVGSRDSCATCSNVQMRFNYDHYGEVNSHLRHAALDLNVAKKGVIIRDPAEVWVSILNRKSKDKWEEMLLNYEVSANALEALVCGGASVICFRRMTTEVSYAYKVLDHFGIRDVMIGPSLLTARVNETQGRVYRTVPKEHAKRIQTLRERIMPWLKESTAL